MFFVRGDAFFSSSKEQNIEKTCLNDTERRKKTPKGVENTKILKKPWKCIGKIVSIMSI